MFMLMIQNHPHRAGSHLRRELVRCLACHGSTLSRVGASGKPGAVQRSNQATHASVATKKGEVSPSRTMLVSLPPKLRTVNGWWPAHDASILFRIRDVDVLCSEPAQNSHTKARRRRRLTRRSECKASCFASKSNIKLRPNGWCRRRAIAAAANIVRVEAKPVQATGAVPLAAAILSCVFVSKSLASWRSCSWSDEFAAGRVDDASALDGRAGGDRIGPAQDVLVILRAEKLGRAVAVGPRQAAIPGPDRHVGDRVFASCDIFALGKATIEHVELTLHLHRVSVDRVFDLDRRISVEVAESAAEIGRAPICQKSHDRHSARAPASIGRKAPNFSAR